MLLRCSGCGKTVCRVELPANTGVRAWIECPECTASAPDYDAMLAWLYGDDTGLSSKAILGIAMNIPGTYLCHPVDFYDFGRCVRMLRSIPSIKIEVMRDVSLEWTRLVESWQYLVAAYDDASERLAVVCDEAWPSQQWVDHSAGKKKIFENFTALLRKAMR